VCYYFLGLSGEGGEPLKGALHGDRFVGMVGGSGARSVENQSMDRRP